MSLLVEVGCKLFCFFHVYIERAQVQHGGITTLASNNCLKHFFAWEEGELKEMLWDNAIDVGKIDYLLDFDCCNELLTLSRTCRKCQYCKSADAVLIHAANYHVAVFIPSSCLSHAKHPWEYLSALHKQRAQDYKSDCNASRGKKKNKQATPPPTTTTKTQTKQPNTNKKGGKSQKWVKFLREFYLLYNSSKTALVTQLLTSINTSFLLRADVKRKSEKRKKQYKLFAGLRATSG